MLGSSVNAGSAQPHPCGRSWWAALLGLAFAINDASAIEVVGAYLHNDSVSRNDLNEVSPHLTGDMGHHFVAIFEHNAKLSIRQCFHNFAFNLNGFFFGHSFLYKTEITDGISDGNAFGPKQMRLGEEQILFAIQDAKTESKETLTRNSARVSVTARVNGYTPPSETQDGIRVTSKQRLIFRILKT